MELSSYILDTQALLRDNNGLITPVSQLTRWINQARYLLALKTGCIECLVAGNCPSGNSAVPGSMIVGAGQPGSNLVQSFQTLVGVEKYPYAYANPFVQANNQGVKAVVEVKQVAVAWGSFRPAMTWWPWQDLQAYARSYNIGVFNWPMIWSDTGDGTRGEVWLWPIPSVSGVSAIQGSQGEMEWLCSCVPKDIYFDADYEAIPEPYQQEIKFGAAGYAMLGAQRYGTAQVYFDIFSDRIGIDRVSVDRGKSGNPYYSSF